VDDGRAKIVFSFAESKVPALSVELLVAPQK
jgi:hypothetical protein